MEMLTLLRWLIISWSRQFKKVIHNSHLGSNADIYLPVLTTNRSIVCIQYVLYTYLNWSVCKHTSTGECVYIPQLVSLLAGWGLIGNRQTVISSAFSTDGLRDLVVWWDGLVVWWGGLVCNSEGDDSCITCHKGIEWISKTLWAWHWRIPTDRRKVEASKEIIKLEFQSKFKNHLKIHLLLYRPMKYRYNNTITICAESKTKESGYMTLC